MQVGGPLIFYLEKVPQNHRQQQATYLYNDGLLKAYTCTLDNPSWSRKKCFLLAINDV